MKDFEFCNRVGKWYRPCNWITVSDYKGPSKSLKRQAEYAWELPLPFAKLLVETETYVGALCQTCGKFIKKDEANEQ